MLPRCFHATVASELAPGLIEVTFFGGCPRWDDKKFKYSGDNTKLSGTVVITFGKQTINVLAQQVMKLLMYKF